MKNRLIPDSNSGIILIDLELINAADADSVSCFVLRIILDLVLVSSAVISCLAQFSPVLILLLPPPFFC